MNARAAEKSRKSKNEKTKKGSENSLIAFFL
jgi:hypothetical protein